VARWEQVEEWGNRAIALAQEVGYSRQVEDTSALLAAANTIRGRYTQALERLAQMESSASRRGALQTKLWGPIMGVGPRMRLGRSAEAVALLEPELAEIEANVEASEKIVAYGTLALAHLRLGNTQQALRTAAKTLEVLRSINPVTFFLYPGIIAMVEVYLTLWEQASTTAAAEHESLKKESRAAIQILRTFARIVPIARPYAQLARGNEAWLSGRGAAAMHAWGTALAEAEQLKMPFEQARARYELGRHLGLQEPARREHLLRARALFSEMGAIDDVEKIQTELDRI
jgi:tetratricopeptide (TPR) repeat protein